MALPDFEAFTQMLARIKHDDQPWGNLFRDICSRRISPDASNDPLLDEQLPNPSLIHVLSTWDFYSSSHLDKAAKDYSVKSWQVTEYVEAVRELLAINESDLIIFESPSAVDNSKNINHLPSAEVKSSIEGSDQSGSDLRNDKDAQEHAPQLAPSAGSSSQAKINFGLIALVSFLLVAFVSFIAFVSGQRKQHTGAASNSGANIFPPADRGLKNNQAPLSRPSGEEVYFSGIDLPVTNTLCNKKRSFCIYNLARLVETESGEASYTYSDLVNGQQVNISGIITIDNIDKSGGGRTFTFEFRDDRASTTPGWAAAGYFNLDQDKDPNKPGILTRFKTTQSFGPKTPVGIENTSYLFPS
jgi:hypothetical protein